MQLWSFHDIQVCSHFTGALVSYSDTVCFIKYLALLVIVLVIIVSSSAVMC